MGIQVYTPFCQACDGLPMAPPLYSIFRFGWVPRWVLVSSQPVLAAVVRGTIQWTNPQWKSWESKSMAAVVMPCTASALTDTTPS